MNPFAYQTQLLDTVAPVDYSGRRWSLAGSAQTPQVSQQTQRPYTASNATSYAGLSQFHIPSNIHSQQSSSSSSHHHSRPSTSDYHHHHHHHGGHPSSGSRPSTTSSISSSSFAPTPTNHVDPFFYNIHNAKLTGSTDTIVPHSSSGGQHEDSNPFYFQRQLMQQQSSNSSSSVVPLSALPHHSSSSSYSHPFYEYATPPSTADSSASFYDHLGHSPNSYGSYHPPNSSSSASGYFSSRHNSNPSLPHPPSTGNNGAHHHQQKNPMDLIIPNTDPATAETRPHLCTHCSETFRRVHDAKRHAYGALGIKNYACMGGCGMSFKRSEGRARHWMREEVPGVGPPGMIWGGKGCEERHAMAMAGTMEEDRRLRNKARRERILTIQKQNKDGSTTTAAKSSSNGTNNSDAPSSHTTTNNNNNAKSTTPPTTSPSEPLVHVTIHGQPQRQPSLTGPMRQHRGGYVGTNPY